MDYTTLQILSRKQLVQLLTKYYQLNFLKLTLHSVPLTDGSVATVPIFDVKALLIAFLNDPLRMCQEKFASNYDIFIGMAKSPTSTLEIHTGSLWEPGSTFRLEGQFKFSILYVHTQLNTTFYIGT
jgi:hypothetical protein